MSIRSLLETMAKKFEREWSVQDNRNEHIFCWSCPAKLYGRLQTLMYLKANISIVNKLGKKFRPKDVDKVIEEWIENSGAWLRIQGCNEIAELLWAPKKKRRKSENSVFLSAGIKDNNLKKTWILLVLVF